jgi:hypothetical protein
VAAAGLVLGQAGDLSAIYPLGRGRAGRSASEEDSAGDSDGVVTHTFALGSHGFQDGGGPTRAPTGPPAMDIVIQGTGTLATDTPMRRIRSTLIQDTGKQMKGG